MNKENSTETAIIDTFINAMFRKTLKNHWNYLECWSMKFEKNKGCEGR